MMSTHSHTTGAALSPQHRRRASLLTRTNPQPAREYLVILHQGLMGAGYSVRLCYVPDKLLLQPAALETYLCDLGSEDIGAPEDLALAILDDVNNEVVPRWIQVAVFRSFPKGAPNTHENSDGYRHAALAEDRQPNWNNRDLLRRAPAA